MEERKTKEIFETAYDLLKRIEEVEPHILEKKLERFEKSIPNV